MFWLGTIPQWPWTSYLHLCASVTKQHDLVPHKGVISLAWKETAGLVESNGSLPLIIYDYHCGLTAKKPGSAMSQTLVNPVLDYLLQPGIAT